MADDLKIYIFRHGQSEFNRDKRFTGWMDAKLTPLGVKQAEEIAEELRDKKFQIAYHTRLSRSIDTLNVVLKYHKDVKLIHDDRMIERSYGELQERYHKDVIADVGKEQFDIWHRSYDVPPPGGESIKIVEKRVLDFIKDLLEKMQTEKINVAISAHGNSMRPFRRYFEKFSVEEMMKLENPYNDAFEYSIPLD